MICHAPRTLLNFRVSHVSLFLALEVAIPWVELHPIINEDIYFENREIIFDLTEVPTNNNIIVKLYTFRSFPRFDISILLSIK